MNVQNTVILLLISFLSLFLLLTSLLFSTIILSNYEDLERDYVEKDLQQAINKFDDEIGSIGITTGDWGPWDDSYFFITGDNPEYIESNLQPDTFDNLNLNIIVFTNATGEIVYSGAYDPGRKEMVTPPEFFTTRIDPYHPLLNTSDLHASTTGILMFPEYPLLVASHPIVRSDFSGEVQGVIIMGRYLTAEETDRLQSLTRQGLSFIRMDDPVQASELPDALKSEIKTETRVVKVTGPDQVTGYTLIRDLHGKDALVLLIQNPREIFRQGISTAFQVILMILGLGLLIGLGLILILNRMILNRINSLTGQVHKISESREPFGEVTISGDDELFRLSEEINLMLQTIRETQKNLLDSEAQFRELVESLPDYVIVCGDDYRIRYLNPATARILGSEFDDITGKPLDTLIEGGDASCLKEKIESLKRDKNNPVGETDITIRGHGTRTVLIKTESIRYQNTAATLLILTDITQRRELEKEREVSAEKMQKYSDSLQKAGRRLNLLSSITRHDILNSTAIVSGFLELTILDNRDPDIGEYLQKMQASIKSIQDQIEFTRTYEDIGTQDPQWIRLMSIMPVSSVPKGVVFINDMQDVSVYADPMLEKVFFNLLDNSIRHGGQVNEIRVITRVCDTDLVIWWEDNGKGIAPDDKERIFERGWGDNTGLGMFLIREILSLTGITIRETGEPGKGARFEIRVPPGGFKNRDGSRHEESTMSHP